MKPVNRGCTAHDRYHVHTQICDVSQGDYASYKHVLKISYAITFGYEGWVKSVVVQTLNRYYPVNAIVIWKELPDKGTSVPWNSMSGTSTILMAWR